MTKDIHESHQPGQPLGLGCNEGLGVWWSTGTVYERPQPRKPGRVNLGPLRRRETD